MTGVEVLAGVAVGYLVRKARRAGGRADGEVDRVIDAGLDAVHDLVGEVLGDDPALAALRNQAGEGEAGERTVRGVTDAIADAAETDTDFAGRLEELIEGLRRRERDLAGEGGGIASAGDAAVNAQMKGEASGHGRVYQAGRDQSIHEK